MSKEQRRLTRRIAEGLGAEESEVLRQAFMEYAKSISLITEAIHKKNNRSSDVLEIEAMISGIAL